MPSPFERIDVTNWEEVAYETGGAEEKWWLRDAEGTRWLFKPVTLHSGHRQGEDWAEKVASEVAGLLGLPVALVELAEKDGLEGSISRNIRPPDHDLQPGSLALIDFGIEDYVPGNVKGRPGHSLENIKRVLNGAYLPPECSLPEQLLTFDVFAGYLVLDAIISNRDRHDENWSVLVPHAASLPARLSPAYDQAGSLGYNLRDSEREDRLRGYRGGVRGWAERGTAWRFQHQPGEAIVSLVTLARMALDLCSDDGRDHWVREILALDVDRCREAVRACPNLSDAECSLGVSNGVCKGWVSL